MDDMIATLLRLAGRRPAVPAEITSRVRTAVHDEWLQQTRSRSRMRWIGVAAALVIAIATATLMMTMTKHAPQATAAKAIVATVQSINGGAISDRGLIESGATILAGQSVETAQSAAASLQWGRATLRLAGGTRVRFDSARRVSLDRGTLFVASAHEHGLVVQTPLGAITDVGTEFEVRLEGGHVRVRVREGRVDLRSQTATAGTELDADANHVVARPISRTGDEWEWIVRAAPPLRLEGRRLREVVGVAAREKGLSVAWPKNAGDPLLHGGVPLAPDEAMDAALAASGLTSRVNNDQLVIERKR
jgi:ferric-dicitrate binding protein FerR (iron transport regulator)